MNYTLLISLISLLLCCFILFYVKWYINKRTTSFKLLPEERTEVNRLIVDLNAVTERNLLLIEDKIKQLKEILQTADKRMSVYVKELEKSRSGEALYTSLGRGIRAALNTTAEPSPAQTPVAETPPSAPPPVESPKAKTPSARQIRAQIKNMINEGLSPGEIASRLDISLAEVDLALDLLNLNTKSVE